GLTCFWLFIAILSMHDKAESCSSTFVIVCCLLSAFLSGSDSYCLVLIASNEYNHIRMCRRSFHRQKLQRLHISPSLQISLGTSSSSICLLRLSIQSRILCWKYICPKPLSKSRCLTLFLRRKLSSRLIAVVIDPRNAFSSRLI